MQDKLDKINAAGSHATTPRSSLDARSLKLSRTDSEPRPRPEDHFEIVCNDTVLSMDMTLASVRQYVWRQSSELVMHYRKKKHAVATPAVPKIPLPHASPEGHHIANPPVLAS